MCGIAGVIHSSASKHTPAMVDAMRHRGPDGRNIWRGQGVSLGVQRLAIMDHAGGQQPLIDDDLVLVANGEIYNHRELRDELESLGARFRSDHSDTEVLLEGYRHWGTDVVKHLNGMFAFALYDQSKGQVLLARDRFAKKPLYVHSDHGGGLVFASEMTALAKHSSMRTDQQEASLPR